MGVNSAITNTMDASKINLVTCAERTGNVGRELQSQDGQRRFALTHTPNGDDSETERHAETGNSSIDDDRYTLASDEESAILSQVNAAALKRPAQAASEALPVRKEPNGNHS